MKSRIKSTYTNPQVVSIIFDEDTTFHEVINQFVKGLVKSKFAPKWEIIWYLKQVEELLNNMKDVCTDCGRKNDGENCPAGGVHNIEIGITTTAHDIHVYDTKHSDNAITITRKEARHLIDTLQNELTKED